MRFRARTPGNEKCEERVREWGEKSNSLRISATFFVTEKGGAKKVSALMRAACTTMARLASRRKLLTRFARSSDMRRSLRVLDSPKSYHGGSQGADKKAKKPLKNVRSMSW